MERFETPPPTRMTDASAAAYASIVQSPLSVLCGRNNSGKSFVLRHVLRDLGDTASYLGPMRHNNFTVLAPYGPRQNRRQQKWQNILNHIQNNRQNIDNSPLDLSQAIAELSDVQRGTLFELVTMLLGSDISLAHTVPDNSMSQKYIQVDGFNLSYTSSGFRLVATLLTCLLDLDYKHVLIDEPELGLSPEVQGVLADFLFNPTERARRFPHLSSIVLATHSPIFLDRRTIGNNYYVTRSNNHIEIEALQTVQDLNKLQFQLLGNRLDTLFLPSAVVLVEGTTDADYLGRVISLAAPRRAISVVRCGNDSRMKDILAVMRQMLGELQRSPYSNRVFAVLDAQHGTGLVRDLKQMGVSEENVLVWSRNGIEYLYPRAILVEKYGEFQDLVINGDKVSANGVTVKKGDLARFVVDRVTPETELPDELRTKLLSPLLAAID